MSDACTPRIPAALSAPSLNRGVGFTHEQRRRLGLRPSGSPFARVADVVYFRARWACLPTDRRHGMASAQAICPSKPSVLAMSR
jgi:hypothetical protein